MFRVRVVLAALLLPLPLTLAIPPASAGPAVTGCPAHVKGDIDGNGTSDMAVIGVRRGLNWHYSEVVYQPGGERQIVQHDGDTGYQAQALADLDGDGCADLVAVHWRSTAVFWGSPSGLDENPSVLPVPDGITTGLVATAAAGERSWVYVLGTGPGGPSDQVVVATTVGKDRTFTNRAVLPDTAKKSGEDGDQFGHSMVAEGDSLFVGASTARVSGKRVAGELFVFTADAADPSVFTSKAYTQNSPGVPGTAELNDGFATSLAIRDGHLAVGVPFESLGRHQKTGMVQLATWDEATRTMHWGRAISQDSLGVPGTNEFEDMFGLSVAVGRGITSDGSYDVVVGAQYERIGRKLYDAGTVTVVPFSGRGGVLLNQNRAAIPGSAEREDLFGFSVAVLPDSTSDGTPVRDRIAVGVPQESLAGHFHAGLVQVSGGHPVNKASWTSYRSTLGIAHSLYFGWVVIG